MNRRSKTLISLMVLVLLAGAALAVPLASTYPAAFWIKGKLTNSDNAADVSGYKVVFYTTTMLGSAPLAADYAYAFSDTNGNFFINVFDDPTINLQATPPYAGYFIGVVKGAGNYGVNETVLIMSADDLAHGYKNVDLTLKLGDSIPDPNPIPITPPPLVQDTGLYISRAADTAGSACIISWDISKFGGQAPKIYVMTGSGTGELNNSYDPNIWKNVFNGTAIVSGYGSSFTASTNGISHLAQVGQGSREVYYKALPVSANPAAGTTFHDAPAVGKVLVTAAGKGNYNMIGVPFIQATGETFVDTFSQVISQTGIEVYKFDNLANGYVPATYSTGWGGANFSLVQGEGAWIYNPLNNDLILTIVGGVPLTTANQTNYSVPIYGGGQYNMISNIYPQGGKLSALGLQPLNGSEIYYFDNVSHGYVSALANGTAWDNDQFIKPGDALWYYNPNSQLPWKAITR